MSDAVSQSTGTIPGFTPSEERPFQFIVDNPTRADVDNAFNKDNYPRRFHGDNQMDAYLKYSKVYDPVARHFDFSDRPNWPGWTRSAKTRNPVRESQGAFETWWSRLPCTPAERSELLEQLRDVKIAADMGDIPCALVLLKKVNLHYGGAFVDPRVKDELAAILENSLFPANWDYMDPATRPAMPYTWPDDTTNSGTGSGTIGG